jgi:hypothetical protein
MTSLKRVSPFLASLLLLALNSCGGGGSTSMPAAGGPPAGGCGAPDCGTAMITITDADGDFLAYSVDVVSLTLTRANGQVVQALPVTSRIDFTQLVGVSEFVTAATVPQGAYVAGTIRLDYTNADVQVEVAGEPVQATVIGEDGQPAGVIDVEVRLDNRNHLVVSNGRPALLQLDFDLAVSNSVDLEADPVTVTPAPIIVASVDKPNSRELRVRGPLVSVDAAAGTYEVDVRPFSHKSVKLGRLTVHTTDDTAWELDGQTYTGADGLTALAALPAGTLTAAFGTLSKSDHVFTADRVLAGSSIEDDDLDFAVGNVVAREGDTLLLSGGRIARHDKIDEHDDLIMRHPVTVLLGPDTSVTVAGEDADVDIGAISVGQRVKVFGTASRSDDDDGDEANVAGAREREFNDDDIVTIDATAGRVRLDVTQLAGTVASVADTTLTLDLDSIDRWHVERFDFTGTGTPGQDADPAAYEVDAGVLDLSRFAAGSPARLFGFVAPFGAAPPDFTARTVVDFESVTAKLAIGYWPRGTDAPFTSVDASAIVVDTANSAIRWPHWIKAGPTIHDVKTLATPLRLVPTAEGTGTFAIGDGHRVDNFETFADFTAALAGALDGTRRVAGLGAEGDFDAGTGDFTVTRMLVKLKR